MHLLPAKEHKIRILSKPMTATPLVYRSKPGSKITIKLPYSKMSVADPKKALADFSIDDDVLLGKISKDAEDAIIFLKKDNFQIPIELSINNKEKEKQIPYRISGRREVVKFDHLYNSDTIQSRNMWRFAPIDMDMSKMVDENSTINFDGYSFKVKPTGVNIVLLELGDLHYYTNALQLSDKPKSVIINIGKPIKGIELLIAAEWKVRLTGMKVGEIQLNYSDGYIQTIPIVNGYNTGSFNAREASNVIYHELEWLKNIYAVSFDADKTRVIKDIKISILTADGSLGILGANIVVDERNI